jgi:hypothetical protein
MVSTSSAAQNALAEYDIPLPSASPNDKARQPAHVVGAAKLDGTVSRVAGLLQRLDTHHGLFALGILEVTSDRYPFTRRP